MSVMLKTTNPEAAGVLDAGHDRRVPYEGQTVIFHCRPGEGRGGKSRAVAVVTKVEDDDHCELLIQFAADDAITRWRIPRKTDQHLFNSWSFNDDDEKTYLAPTVDRAEVRGLHNEVESLQAECKTLTSKIASLEGELRRLHQQRK